MYELKEQQIEYDTIGILDIVFYLINIRDSRIFRTNGPFVVGFFNRTILRPDRQQYIARFAFKNKIRPTPSRELLYLKRQ